MSQFFDCIAHQLEPATVAANVERLTASATALFKPDSRHDSVREQEADSKRQAICLSHRFQSFAPEREHNVAKWYSDGHDYFWAVSEMLDNAQDFIAIMDWWLTPELYLRRPPALFPDYRLDRLLQRKAESGVKVRIIVYEEVTQTATTSSRHTVDYMNSLHPNIQAVRHPDHIATTTLFWSHHEKVVLCDNHALAVGGLDLCYGRWDTHSHPLADVHPSDMQRTLFPGQDYNNARIEDFQNVTDWLSNNQSRLTVGRMPWHDVHVTMVGPVALDMARHVAERWNFVVSTTPEYMTDDKYKKLALPNGALSIDDVDPQFPEVRNHPHTIEWEQVGEKFLHPFTPQRFDYSTPHAPWPSNGTCNIQMVRSSADWSSGILKESSIQTAYLQLIEEAEHFIYIENQFFITATSTEDKQIENQLGQALVHRILRAAREGTAFHVVICIPCIPCFAGDLDKADGLLAIMAYQYQSICRGPTSIFGLLRQAGVNPAQYFSFYNLRGFDRILNDGPGIEHAERVSGVSYVEMEASFSRQCIGDLPEDSASWYKEHPEVKIRSVQEVDELNGRRQGQRIAPESSLLDKFKLFSEGDEDIKAQRSADRREAAQAEENSPPELKPILLPSTAAQADQVLKRFSALVPELNLRPSIASNILEGQPRTEDEKWPGASDEKENYYTEETYIHSKLMIVDDRRVIIGSANINDRSMCGDRDSEVAVVIEDHDMFASIMNGEPWEASKFASSFRRFLWRQHLGWIKPQECNADIAREYPTDAMRPAPHPIPDPASPEGDLQEQEWEQRVADPLSAELLATWKAQAEENTAIYAEVFHPVPDDRVRDWKDYYAFYPQPPQKRGHVADADMPTEYIKERLSGVRGCLVTFPTQFLDKLDLFKETEGPEVNKLTYKIYT